MNLGRIAFAGTPDFAVPTLAALLDVEAAVSVVFTQPDRPFGRGRQLKASPVKVLAERNHIPLCQVPRFEDRSMLASLGPAPDLLVVVAYGLILPDWLLAWPRIAAVNVHASILPRWRGAAPIQRAILAGDSVTGVSIMQMDTGLDTGSVYRIDETPIANDETALELHDRLALLGAQSLVSTIPGILDGSAIATPQQDALATYAHKITKSESIIDWSCSAVDIDRKVRGFAGWPVAESKLSDGRRIRIWSTHALDTPSSEPPGTIVVAAADGIDVATGSGTLRIKRLQAPGGRVTDVGAWLAAHDVRGVAFDSL